jgi:hypothetical protein
MSKGEIVSHKGYCLYSVRLKYAVDRVKAELAEVNARIAELAIEVPEQKLAVIQAEEVASDLVRSIDLLIPDYRDDPVSTADQMRELQSKLVKQRGEIARLVYSRDRLIAENLGLLKRRGVLEAIPEDKLIDAWCSDYSDSLVGDVGLVDINDEGRQGVVIQPGHDNNAGYNPSRDGILVPREAQSGVQVYFNAAVLPGVQKWHPRYRVGIISNIENDACVVSLLPAVSSEQSLNINQFELYSDVPIQYMECNGEAFEDGDRVLVRFTDSGPLVVGFEKEPRPCGMFAFIFQPSKGLAFFSSKTYGKPFLDEFDNEINPPLGTESGADPAWIAEKSSTSFNFERGQDTQYGVWSWIGRKKSDVLTWHGHESRVCDPRKDERLYVGGPGHPVRGPKVFYKNSVIFDSNDYNGIVPVGAFFVEGAAFNDRAGQRYLRVTLSNYSAAVAENDPYHIWIYEFPFDSETYELGAMALLAEKTFPGTQWQPVSGMYFSSSGEKAVQTVVFGSSPSNERLITRFQNGEITTESVDVTLSGTRVRTPLDGNLSAPVDRAPYWYNGTTTRTDTWTTEADESLLYVEMVGEEEKRVTLLSPEYVEVRSYNSNSSASSYIDGYDNDGEPVILNKTDGQTRTWSISEQSGSFKILCDGKVLAGLSDGHSRLMTATLNISGAADSTGSGRTYTFNYSETIQSRTLTPEYIFIDARSGYVAGCIPERQLEDSATSSGIYDTDDEFTLSGVQTNRWSFAVWKNGVKLHEEETYNLPTTYGPQTGVYSSLTRNVFDDTPAGTYFAYRIAFFEAKQNPTITRYLGPAPSPLYRPISFVGAAGDAAMAAASFMWRRDNDEYSVFTDFPEYEEPISQIIDRSEADLFFFRSISLI